MKLTHVERVLLINQFSIRKVLEKTDGYDQIIEILTQGYEMFYGDAFFNISGELSEADCRFVLDVLSMYEAIEFFKRSAPNDGEVMGSAGSSFFGFDGNK